MQRLIQIAVSDASLFGSLMTAITPDLLHVLGPAAKGAGTFGLGFAASGDMLVRKAPLRAARDVIDGLAAIQARHVVACTDGAPAPRPLEDRQPLRYRDWLFAASGTHALGEAFIQVAQARLPSYAFSHRRFPSSGEAVLMLLMAALERRNTRDVRDLTTCHLQRAIAEGLGDIRAVMEESGQQAPLAIGLHVAGHLFALPLGRQLWLTRYRGTGIDTRPGRGPVNPHLRAVLVLDGPELAEGGDHLSHGEPPTPIPEGKGLELAEDVEARLFDL